MQLSILYQNKFINAYVQPLSLYAVSLSVSYNYTHHGSSLTQVAKLSQTI